MDRINELLANLPNLTGEELDELSGLIAAEVDDAVADTQENGATAQAAELLSALGEAQEAANGEVNRRAEAQAEIDARVQEQIARLRPTEDSTGTEGEEPTEDDGDESGEGESTEGDAPAEAAPVEQRETVAASARPALRRLSGARTAPRAPQPVARLAKHTATDASNGRTIDTTRAAFAETIARGIERTRGGRAVTSDTALVSVFTEFPKGRTLGSNLDQNEALVAAAEAEAAGSLVAAGGLCAPIPNLYDIEVIGTDARPLRAALTVFGAERGGVALRQSIRSEDAAAGVGSWTLTDDAAVGVGDPADDPVKPIADVVCPGFDSFYVEATTARMRFSNITSRFDPESTAANTQALRNFHARVAERKLWNKMLSYSTTLTAAGAVSAVRDVLVTIDKAQAYYRDYYRLGDNENLWIVLPRWVRDMIRADLTRGAQTADALNIADAAIDAFFTNRKLRITWHFDGRTSAATSPTVAAQQYGFATSGGTVPGFPDQVEFLLARPNDFLFLDGGQLDLGVVRDSGLNSQNRYELFFETFEGVAFRGVDALRIVQTAQPTGAYAAPVTTSALTD